MRSPPLRRSVLVLAVALVAAACAGPPVATCTGTEVLLRQAGALTVALDYSYPPYAFRGLEGDLEGFDVDLARALAEEMGLEVGFVNRGSGALVPGAISRRHDLAASALRDGPELRTEACVSAPYLDADLAILVAAGHGSIAGPDDLGGRTVAVLEGGRAEEWALAELDGSTLASLPTHDDLLTAVQQDQADAAVEDLPFVRFAAKRSGALDAVGRIETGEGFVFVTGPDNAALIRRVDAALAELRSNGTLRRLQRQWFG